MADFITAEDHSAAAPAWSLNTAQSSFLSLPEEIHIQIMAYLPVPDMLVHSRTCKFLYLAFSSSLLLQLLASLHTAALSRLASPTSFTAAQQIALLHEHTLGWSTLLPQRRYVIPMPAGIWLGWKADLRGGYYVEADEGHMAILKLPCSGQGLKTARVKVVRDIVGCVEEVLVDPSQDLLAYVTRTIDRSCLMIGFRTLSGAPHPEALCELEYRQTWHGDFPGVKLFAADLCGPYLAIVVLSFLGRRRLIEIVVWNWKEGKIHSKFQPKEKHYETITFISPTTLLTVSLSPETPTLDVYTIVPSLRLSHSLCLPQLSTDIRMSVLLSPNRALPARLPFICPPERRLIAVTLRPSRVTSRIVEAGMYTLFTMASTLLQPPLRTCTALDQPSCIPWSDWGPSKTRVIPHDPTLSINPHGPNFIHSTRAIFAVPSSPQAQPNEGVHFRVVDFNQFALRRDPKSGDVHDETVIQGTPFWFGEIRTSLPYRERTTDDVYENPLWVFLDEERIVSVRREELGVEPGGQRRVRNVLEVVIV